MDLEKAPSESSKRAEIAVEVTEGEVTLTPDGNFLTDPATVFPVYLDPLTATRKRSDWTMVASGYPNQEYHQFPGKNNEGMGQCPQLSGDPYGCNGAGLKRLFYKIPTAVWKGKHIISAEFAITLRHTYNSTAKAMDIHWTSQNIGASTNWNNQPGSAVLNHLETKSPTGPASSCTDKNRNVRFNAKAAVEAGLSAVTFRLRADNDSSGGETDHTKWKRFCENAQLEVRYTTPPKQPKQSELSMTGGSCISGSSRPVVNTTGSSLKLSAILRDADDGDQLRAHWRVHYTNSSGTKVFLYDGTPSTAKASGSTFAYSLATSSVPQNTVIGWSVRAYDGYAHSPWSWDGDAQTECQFVYDSTAPKPPTVTSPQYPADDTPHDGVGSVGAFTFDSPSNDVVSYKYGFNTDVPDKTIATTGGAPQTVYFTPMEARPMWVTVVAKDLAGNEQTTRTRHDFLVAEGRSPVAYYKLNEQNGTSFADSSGNNRTATAQGGVTPGVAGRVGSAASFNDVDGYAETSAAVLDPSKSYAVSAWAKATATVGHNTVISQDGQNTEAAFRLEFTDTNHWAMNGITGDWWDSPNSRVVSNTPLQVGKWAHLVGVHDAQAKTISLYVNGVLQSSAAFDAAPWTGVPSGPLTIGRSKWHGAAVDFFPGDIDDVRVFDRVVSAGEVAELVKTKTVRKGYWPLNDVASGVSPNLVNGGEGLALSGTATHIRPDDSACDPDFGCSDTAIMGEGHLLLNGTDAYAATGNAPVGTDQSFTAAVRVKLTNPSPTSSMTVLGQKGSVRSGFQVRYDASLGQWQLVVPQADSTTATTTVISDAQNLPSSDGVGDHLAVVYSEEQSLLSFYVNGQLSGQSTYTSGWNSTGGLQVGRRWFNGSWGEFLGGAVDEVRVYQGILDEAAIVQLAGTTELPDM